MYTPRKIEAKSSWLDDDGIKIYTISVSGLPVNHDEFNDRLLQIKRQQQRNWSRTPAFAIFHDGASCRYLILAWWDNDNELFTSVSVQEGEQWVENPRKYSFCLYDLEVFWTERNAYIETMDCATPNLNAYQLNRGAFA